MTACRKMIWVFVLALVGFAAGVALAALPAGYGAQNAGKLWSLSFPDSSTIRFEVRQGEHASFDDNDVDRSEMNGPNFPSSSTLTIQYQFMWEPGAANNAQWTLLTQMHAGEGNPPFTVSLSGERLSFNKRSGSCCSGTSTTLWTDSNDLVRGRWYDIQIEINFSQGRLKIWKDNVQVVNYTGSLGYGGSEHYVKAGIYRSTSSATQAVNFRNWVATTSSVPPLPPPSSTY